MMTQARKSQRIFAFLFDFFIISLVASLISSGVIYLIGKTTGYLPNEVRDLTYNLFLEEYKDYMNSLVNGVEVNASVLYEKLYDFIKASMTVILIDALSFLVVLSLYMVPSSLLWKWQTLGRRIMMCRVVKKDGSEMTIKNVLLREILGTWFLMSFIGSGLFIFISLILVLANKRSILDCVSDTKCVTLRPDEIVESEHYHKEQMDKFKNEDDDYIDAKWKDLDEDSTKSNDNNQNESNDDDYKII